MKQNIIFSKTTLLSFVLLTVGTFFLPAQSQYTPDKKSSVGVSGGFSFNDDATSLDLGIGFSILGRGDLGLGYSKLNFKDKLMGEEISASLLGFSGSVFPLKQSSSIPVSLAITGALGFSYYSSDVLDYLGWDMTATLASFGLDLYHRIDISNSFALMPSLGFSYTHTKLTIEDSYGDSVEDTDSQIGFGVGLGFLFPVTRSGIIILRPSLFLAEESTTFGIALGFVEVF
jgi:hypothetical protein